MYRFHITAYYDTDNGQTVREATITLFDIEHATRWANSVYSDASLIVVEPLV